MKLQILLIAHVSAIGWLGITKTETDEFCQSESFDHIQKRLCERHSRFIPAIRHAAQSSIRECNNGMNSRRWGCKSLKSLPILKREMRTATVESAFVQALSSAQLTSSMYRLCESGTVGTCSRHNIQQFVTEFTDAVSIRHKTRAGAQIEMHNAKVGRETSWRSKGTICKCHGQSGSCTQKTCWRTAPDDKVVISKLTKKYDHAAKIFVGSDSFPAELSRFVAHDRLLYTEPKRSYCQSTRGRTCEPDSNKSDSCDKMCCNRGFIQKQKTIIDEYCRFIWPASVKCEPAIKTFTTYLCK